MPRCISGNDPGGLDDDVFIALTHQGGVRSHLWGSWRQGAPGPRLRATGTSGTYVIQDADGQEARLRSGGIAAAAGDGVERWGAEPPERWGHLRRGDVTEPVPAAHGAWNLFYPAFAAAVRGIQPVPVEPVGRRRDRSRAGCRPDQRAHRPGGKPSADHLTRQRRRAAPNVAVLPGHNGKSRPITNADHPAAGRRALHRPHAAKLHPPDVLLQVRAAGGERV